MSAGGIYFSLSNLNGKFDLVFRYLNFITKLFEAKLKQRRIPLIVILCVTNRCNLNCWYCYGEHPYRYNRPDFTTDELLSIIRTLYTLGTRILQIQGGEPLMRNDLKIIVKEAKRLGMICEIVTNGVLISQKPDVIKLFDKICVSLDGPAKVNDRNRGKDTFRGIVEGIKIACDLGLPVRISSMLTSESVIEDINWLMDFARKNSVLVNFSPSFEFISRIRTDGFKPHIIPDEHLRVLFQHIIKCKREGAPIQFSAKSYTIAAQWPFTYQKRMVQSKEISADVGCSKCYHGEYVFFIDSDGSIYPCCNFWGQPTLNIRTHGLKKSIFDIDNQGCKACYIPAYIERNLFFNGVSGVWWNYIRQAIKGAL